MLRNSKQTCVNVEELQADMRKLGYRVVDCWNAPPVCTSLS
jgi:hypothetical protein